MKTHHSPYQPLAARMRPLSLETFVGQRHLVAPGKPLATMIEKSLPHSMILWGPPGSGKTTLAKIIATRMNACFETLSAVLAGVKEIREVVARAKKNQQITILFVDEAHRFNKAQQDAFLPHVEDGSIIFIGATTENPSFALNNALLSRTRIYVLKALNDSDLSQLITMALTDREHGLGEKKLSLDKDAEKIIIAAADGDARQILNILEIATDFADDKIISKAIVQQVIDKSWRRFDRGGDIFYDQISALHKAVRGSSPDAALYWLARMLDGGCDPLYIARRAVRMASEDIGNADPRALQLTLNAWDTQQRLGSPEGELAIAQAIVYMACAAKSNAVYTAFNDAMADARRSGSLEVPLHLRNAPTTLMKELNYGKDYRYAHDEPDTYAAGENYFPDKFKPKRYYYPRANGLEIKIAEKLERLRILDEKHKNKK
ncbi:MAG: replication-associated recombination protein A [Pseudomonadota bacterium]